MIIIDAVIGNGDRHAGNFGWLRNTDTGEYVSMAPLYDSTMHWTAHWSQTDF